MLVERLRALLDRLERPSLAGRLLLAWAACVVPRAGLAAAFGLGEDYGFFVHGRTDSAWYPFYEVLASLLWRASGGYSGLYFAAHLAIHSALGPIVYGLVKQLGLGARVAWLSVAGVAVMPYYASLSARQPQVGVAVVMLALLLLGFVKWISGPASRAAALGFALLSGLTVTLRPNAVSVIAVLYGLAWIRAASGGERAEHAARRRAIVLSVAAFAAVLLALAADNLRREGRFSPFTGNIGFNLYVGNNPKLAEYALRYDITSLQDSLNESLPADYATTPVDRRDRLLLHAALRYMAEHPWQSAWNAVLKSWRYWDPRLEDAWLTPRSWNLAYSVPYVVYGLLAGVGALSMWRRGPRDALVLIVATLVAYWLPHAVLYGAVRMRMTTEFLLIVLAAYAVDETPSSRRTEPSCCGPSARAAVTAASTSSRSP